MDKVKKLKKATLKVLADYQKQFKQTSQNIKNQIIADDKNNHFQFLWTGWKGDQHIFSIAFHIDILQDKIWIQKDNTEVGVANLLVENGVAKDDIVLAYFSPAHRKLTEFAVA